MSGTGDIGDRIKPMFYILIAIAVILIAGSIWGGKVVYTGIIDRAVKEREAATLKGYQDEIDRLNGQIREKDAALKQSEKRYSAIVGMIKEKASQADNIKPPASSIETKKRLKDLGYEAH